ncbi:PLP-dependent transferase [Halopelagius fulvigenes]|uniref:PLP-dependent transferase n=1 Tax=Halopelagius fulvigenes TaxID=1198324 RepID=A0ABD5TYD4_9EURY
MPRVRRSFSPHSHGSVPSATTASNLSADERERAGISESLVRAPIGIEDPADLIGDLSSALGNL